MDEKIICKNCGYELKKDEKPCPECGCKGRKISVVIYDKIGVSDKIEAKGKHKGCKKPFKEVLSGSDLHRKTGVIYNKERTIDRDNDIYKEVIKDKKTGKIIHRCEEPLSKHIGHGSAKGKNKKNQKEEV